MIRKIFKLTLIISFALIAHNHIWGNLDFNQSIAVILKTALILSFFKIFIRPVIKLLLLPINILTLGTIRLVINTFGLYLATFLIADFSLFDISTQSGAWQGFSLPPLQFSGFFAYLVTSISLNIIISIFNKILYKKAS